MKHTILWIALILVMFSCKMANESPVTDLTISYHNTPALSPSAEPYLFTDQNDSSYLSWIEKTDSAHIFKYARWTAGKWSEPSVIATGNNWFVNWADYPMMAADGGKNFIAHVLNKSGDDTYAYDVQMYASKDSGLTWDSSFLLHDDGQKAEHGFVTLLPYQENIFVAWLDGRNTVMEGMENMKDMNHDGHHGAMSLRGAIIDYSGNKIDEWELDNKTCDCCQTTATITANGPVVVYRDRSDEEIRDMSIVRLVNGVWTEPKTIFPDNWKIAGCPVNGPRTDAIGNSLAIAWFSTADEQAEVKLIFSADGGANFDEPIRIDGGEPIGRVDVLMLDEENAMVSWMEGTNIMAMKVNKDGSKGAPIAIATSSESRSSGFPQMTRSGDEVLFAWTDDADKKVKSASLKLLSDNPLSLADMNTPYKPLIKASSIGQYPSAVVIDARGGPDARDRYLKGHIPGALFVDLETQLSNKAPHAKDGGRHPLPKIESFTQLLSELGIANDSPVIVYDDKMGANAAARFWWMMRAVGHQQVYVVDGGLQAIINHGISLSTESTKPDLPANYVAHSWQLPIATLSDVKQASEENNQLIIDVREAYRYNGESEPIDKIAGHIPGAINAPYIDNLNEDGEFLSEAELQSKYKKILKGHDTDVVIVHCGSGVTACHTLLALEQAGIKGAQLYVGSWSEWSRNDLPMITK